MPPTRDEDATLLTKSLMVHSADSGAAGRAHYLHILEGEEKGRRIELGKAPMVIGRSAPADIILPDSRISRSHCRICLAMEEVIVIDLESSNGTYIDGKRLSGGGPLPIGARLQVGSHVLEHEWRIRKEVQESQELDRDIEQAWHYIQSMLPAPLTHGPIRSDWVLIPCTRLGGDVFGYRFLDSRRFAIYLLDVSGHGTGAAMHAVSVLNVLRRNVLPEADYADPGKVLAALNDMFRMETHGNLYLTTWYGVYDLETRVLSYATAGHHPSFLVGETRDDAIPLRTRNPVIGVAPDISFKADTVSVAPGSTLYVFSDGAYEVVSKAGTDLALSDFVALLLQHPTAGVHESQRLLRSVRELAKNPTFEDDFSVMALTFVGEGGAVRTPDETWPNRG